MIDDNTKEELRRALPLYVDQITYKSRKGSYICPICKSGTGKNKTGAFSIFDDGKAWQCFSCHNAGDIFKLIELVENKSSFTDQVTRAAEIAGTRVDVSKKSMEQKPIVNIPAGRYAAYIKKCHDAVSETDYYYKRGFTDEVIKRFKLGYDTKKKAIVIPYGQSANYYLTRNINEKVFDKPKTKEAGPEPVYNKYALYDNKPCFVCESPIDAISIMSVNDNCNAIALGGTGSEKLIKAIQEKRPECILILNFDNDAAGREATEDAAEKLTEESIDFIIAEYPEESLKDANEMLVNDVCQLMTDIAANIARAEVEQEKINDEKLRELNERRANNILADLLESEIFETPCISTGFDTLDRIIDGGFYPGLCVLGAVSSMGKTSFMLQLADQIAANNNDVLFITLEQGTHELMAKSLSRYSYIEANKNGYDAVYSRTITNRSRRAEMTIEQRLNFDKATERYYSEVSNNIWFYESIGEIGIEEIKQIVGAHIRQTNKRPVLFIDYLQILKPYSDVWTEKRNTDKAVIELRKMARDHNITVFAISSLNRGAYIGDIEMSAFKESGAIEYGSDLLLALQPVGMQKGTYKKGEKANAELMEDTKLKENREVELKILKNRTGKTGNRITYSYNAKFNYFQEGTDGSDITNTGWEPVGGVADIF